jgi:hypothetical protein
VLVKTIDSFDTNILHVILEIVVVINKTIARFEFKIVKKYIVGVIGIISASSAINTVVFCIDSEMVKVVIIPIHGCLNEVVQLSERCSS